MEDADNNIETISYIIAVILFFVIFPIVKGFLQRGHSMKKTESSADQTITSSFFKVTDQNQRDGLSNRFLDVEFKKYSANRKNHNEERIPGLTDLRTEEIEFIIQGLYGDQKNFVRDLLSNNSSQIEKLNLFPSTKEIWESSPEAW